MIRRAATNVIGMSRDVAIEVTFDRSSRLWCGVFRHRETQNQIGDSWWGATRDEVLVFSGMHWMAERLSDAKQELEDARRVMGMFRVA